MALFWQDSFENETGPDLGTGTRVAVGHDDTNNGTGPFDRDGNGSIDSSSQVELGIGNDPAGNDNNYFVRYDGGRSPDLGVDRNYFNGSDGDFIWIGEDVRDSRDAAGDAALRDDNLGIIDWKGIDTSGLTDISFKGLFVSNQNGGTYEIGDFVRVSYAFDSTDEADLVTGLQFLGSGVKSDGLIWDENLNGVIDANETTEMGTFVGSTRMDMEEFSFDLTGSGDTLYLRYQLFDATSGGSAELAAIDNFRLDNAGTAPAPADNVIGNSSDNRLVGTEDSDTILGFGGDDILFGKGGDDTLFGGADDDELNGGAGADTLNGGDGIDTVVYRGPVAVTVNLTDTSLNTGEAAGDTYIRVEEFSLTTGNDIFVGDRHSNTVDGQNGDDDLDGMAGKDILFGRNGDDTIDGGTGADRVNGGNDNDTLFGGGGDDRLFGGDGDDVLTGGDGLDIMVGGAGADTFVFDVASTDGDRDFILQWEDGVDTIRYENSSQTFADLTLTDVLGANGVDVHTLITSDYGVLTVYGIASADFDASDFAFVPAPVGGNGVAEALEAAPKPALYAADDSDDGGVFDAFDIG